MKRFLSLLFIPALLSCNNQRPNTTVKTTKPVENITPTRDQAERRRQSEAYCQSHNIPFYNNPNSLFVDPENEVVIRTKDEVVDRALALCYMGLKSEGFEQIHLNEMDISYRIAVKLTPLEKAYATANLPTAQQKIDANWGYESLHVMLWALNFIDTLSYPGQTCNIANDVKIIHDLTEEQFRQKAKLRSKKEILNQEDLILRIDWACVNARINNQAAPGKLDKDVVSERHHSLNWLINYLKQDWDDVTNDT